MKILTESPFRYAGTHMKLEEYIYMRKKINKKDFKGNKKQINRGKLCTANNYIK